MQRNIEIDEVDLDYAGILLQVFITSSWGFERGLLKEAYYIRSNYSHTGDIKKFVDDLEDLTCHALTKFFLCPYPKKSNSIQELRKNKIIEILAKTKNPEQEINSLVN